MSSYVLVALSSTSPYILTPKILIERSIAIVFYDHVITIADEVNYVWRRHFALSGTALLFLCNRLMVLVYGISMLMQVPNLNTRQVCVDTSHVCDHSHFCYEECATSLILFYVMNIVLCLTSTGGPAYLKIPSSNMYPSVWVPSSLCGQRKEHPRSSGDHGSGSGISQYQHCECFIGLTSQLLRTS